MISGVRTHRIVFILATAAAFAVSACTEESGPAAGTAVEARGAEPATARPSSAAPSAQPPGSTRAGTRPPIVTNGPRTGNRVALTFDADLTDAMLRQLRSGQVKSFANLAIIDRLERDGVAATFFLTGMWVEQYPELTTRLAANPRFELANHSFGHQGFTPRCYTLGQVPPHRMTEDVARTFTIIQRYGGRQTRYFRFPGLCHDDAALTAMAPLGITVVDADVISGDPFATAWRPIVDAVLSTVRAGSIIVLHVTEANARYTDEALPHILAGLRDRGLTPAPLSEVLGGAGS